jgi:excisionase family DNA binding protein
LPAKIEQMNDPALTTSQVAQLLGTSRQHAANLADRGAIASWRVGTHRRFMRADVLLYRDRTQSLSTDANLQSLNLADRRSLAYGLLIAAKLVASTESVLARAQRNLTKQQIVHSDGSADCYLNAWAELLVGPTEAILHALTSLDHESVALRHAAPFAGVLSETDRLSVIRSTRRAAA